MKKEQEPNPWEQWQSPDDHLKYRHGDWITDERIKLIDEIAGKKNAVNMLEGIDDCIKERGEVPDISHMPPSSAGRYIAMTADQRASERVRFLAELEKAESRLKDILFAAAMSCDVAEQARFLKFLKAKADFERPIHDWLYSRMKGEAIKPMPEQADADPDVAAAEMALIRFINREGKLPTQDQLFNETGRSYSDKQKRRVIEAIGAKRILPRKERERGYGGPSQGGEGG